MNIFDYAKKLGVETSAENSTLTADQKLKNDAINSSDFEEYANKGLAISNPTRREANGFLGLKTLNWFNFKTGETEVKRFGKEIKNKATYARDVFVNSDKTQIVDTDLFDYTFMNDDEIKIYSYYLAKYGEDKAEEYFKTLLPTLRQRTADSYVDQVGDSKLAKIGYGFGAGIEQFASGIQNVFRDDVSAPSAVQLAGAEIRESMGDGAINLPKWLGGASLGQIGYDTTQTTGNMLPSMLLSAIPVVGQGLSLGAMGLSAGGNAYADMINQGYSKDEARNYALMVGASEALLQKFLGGISSIGGKSSGVFSKISSKVMPKFKSAAAKAAVKYGGSMLDEGLEEAVQEVLDPVFKKIATGDEFEGVNLEDVLYSGLLGAISGGVIEGTTSGTTAVTQKYLQRGANAEAKKAIYPELNRLIEEGKKYANTSARATAIEKKIAAGKEATGYELRMLAYEVNQASKEANVDTVRQAIIEKMKSEGLNEKQAKRLGEIALNKALGNDVTKIQDVMLKRNETALKTYNQIDENNMKSGLTDSQWIEKTPLQQLRNDAKARKEGANANTNAVVERLKADMVAKKIKAEEASLEGKFTVSEDDKIKFKKSGKDSKIHTEEITTSLTKEEIVELTAIEKIANELGVEIYVYESKRNKDGSRTFTKADGEVTSDSGWYDPNDRSIHIDLRAGKDGEGTMLYTAAHELVHFMKDVVPEYYEALEKLVTDALVKSGVSIEKALEEQRQSLIENGKDSTDANFEEVAREEMIADACMKFLASKSAVAEIKALKTKNHGLWNALKKFFTSLFTKINKAYKTVEPDSSTAQYLSQMRNAIKPIRDAFMEGVAAAGNKMQSESETKATFEKSYQKTKDIRKNARYTKEHIDKLKSIDASASSVPIDNLVERYETIIGIWNELGGELNSEFLKQWNDKSGKDRAFSVFKAQAGYKYNVELSSMCKKGIPLFEAIDQIVRSEVMNQLNTKTLGKAEKEILYELLKERKFDIPCAICYVEQARQREGDIIDAFLDGKIEKTSAGKTKTHKIGWNETFDALEKGMKARGVDYTFKDVSRNIASDSYTKETVPSMDEKTQKAFYDTLLNLINKEISRYNSEKSAKTKARMPLKSVTPSEIKRCLGGTLPANLKLYKTIAMNPDSRFRIKNDLLYSSETTTNLASYHHDLYSLFNMQGGVSGYKSKQGTVVYWGDILTKNWDSSKLKKEGGVRNQSNSDFMMYTLLDQAQMYIDFTAKGYYLQAYTKVLSELKLFGLSKGKINASLIPRVEVYRKSNGDIDDVMTRENAGLDKNGNPIYDDIEGIPHEEAFMLIEDAEYSKSIGGICIGYSDNHISKLLDDSRIQLIIGYHDKTDDPNKRYYGARYAKNYNGENEARIKNDDGTFTTKHVGFNQYIIAAEKLFKKNVTAVDYEGKTYKYDDIPKLAADMYLKMCADKNYIPAYNQFSSHENYYKLLADFSLYDSEGHYAPHQKVAYDMPDVVPYLDADGNKKYMPTRDYIKKELKKELTVRDDISATLSDHSEEGLIPQFIKKVNELHSETAKQESAKREIRSKARVVDTNGNELTEAQQEYFKDSTVRDSKGNLMVLYHGTTANFNEFKKGDVGFHFGTKGAARGRVGYGKNVTLKEVYLNIKNPIVFDDDLGSWDADYRLTRELYDRGILTQAEAETVLLTDSKLYRRTTEAANKKLAEVLLAKGYDGIQYTNTHESKKDSTSYIIFDSNQAKLITNTNPTTSKDIRHKARGTVANYTEYDKPITTGDVEVLRTIGRKSINDFTSEDTEKAQKWAYNFYQELGAKSPFFRAWFGDWREYDRTPVNIVSIPNTAITKQRSVEGIKNIDASNEHHSWYITVTGHGERNTKSHAANAMRSVKGLTNILGLVENGILLDSEVHEHHSNNATNDLIAFDHKIYSLGVNESGELALYKLTVEELYQDWKHPDVKRFHNLRYVEKVADIPIKKVAENLKGRQDFKESRAVSFRENLATKYSVADLFALVKTYDKDFKPKSANPLLLDENKQPKVVYHGTPNGKFTEFDYDKVGTVGGSQHGYGFYFADSEREAKLYTQGTGTVIPAYINLKNPIDAMRKDLSSNLKTIFERLPRYAINNLVDEYGSLEAVEKQFAKYDNGTMISILGKATGMHPEVFNSVLLNLGYDGIIYAEEGYDTEYVVFKPEQIKSATNNIGTFDKGEKSILHKARRAPSTAIPYTSPTAKSIVTDIDSGYEYTKRDKIKTGYIAAQIAMTNAQAGIEARAKQYGVKNIESLVQAARVATNQAQEMIGGNQYRIGSDAKDYLGEGLQKIIAPVQEKGEEYERTFYDYLFHYHNADRMSLERRSIEWNEQKKEEMKNLAQRAKEIRNEEIKLTGEKTKWAYKRSEEARSERNRIDLKLKELSRELVSIGKARRKLQKEIDSFTALKNKPVIGLNHDEVEAKKAEISASITELVAEKRKLGTKKANEEKVKEINAEIEALKKERSELTAEVTEEKSREIIAEYEKNYPEFIDTAQKLWKYSENLNLVRVDTGLIDQEQFDYLKKLYPHYVPSYRADTKTGIAAIKGKNNVAVSQSIRTATGSTKDLLNPIVIMARQTMETIRAGRINMIAKSLYDGAAAHNDTTYIKEISKKPVDKSKLVDLDPMELRPKSNQVTFFDKGERITLQVSSDIFAGFDAFTPQVDATNPIIQITHKMNDIFKKLVTSWNPFFIVRNSVRDIQDAGLNTKYGKTFVQNYVRTVNEIRKDSQLWQLFKAMGGTNVNLFDFDKGFKGAQSKMGFEAGWKAKIANANAFVECLPRFAEFISSIEAGNTAEQAMLDAADITTNFARTGTITKKLNSTIIPFLNPAIQGASKAIRNITSIRSVKDGVTLAAKAAMVGVIPFILNNLLYQGDDEYEDLKETDKENNYLIKVGDVFFKLPRGRMASVLAGATNRTINSIEGEENAWKGYIKNVSTQMNPVENMARTIFSPFMDVKNNVTWYGSAIEGREFENKSPSQRYDESTSSIAIALGKVLNYSPKKIHYILDQYSGVVGDFILPATTKKAEKGFVSGNFVIDPVTSNKLSDQFYDMYYDAQYAKSDDPDDKTAEYQVKHLNRIKSAISELYDKKDEIQNSNMSNKEKLAETRAIQILINEMYKTALNDYELVTNAIEATSSVDDKYRYTEVQRLVYGAETALKDYDDAVYEKSTLLTKMGISYDNFYKYYFGIKDVVSDKDKNGNTISGSKKKKVIEKINELNVSEEKKLLLIAYSGYTIDSEKDREKLLKYINRLTLSANDKKKLAEMCNFEYKNGKIVLK